MPPTNRKKARRLRFNERPVPQRADDVPRRLDTLGVDAPAADPRLGGFAKLGNDGKGLVPKRGAVVEREAVIGANVVLTASTRVVDVTGPEPVEFRGRVPSRSVVIPGTRAKRFPAGEYGVPCALIIGQRSQSTDRKVSLEQALRDYEVLG